MLADLVSRVETPTARGLADAVSAGIREGAFPSGTRLPPIRAVAKHFGVSPSTVASAWSILARAGLIHSDGRAGTTITDRAGPGPIRYRRALEFSAQFELDLSTGLPDPALLPDLKPALRRLDPAADLKSYLDQPVLPELLDLLYRDWPYAADAITLADGATDALDLVISQLVRFGDSVAVEALADPALLDLLEAVGAKLVPVDLDEEGPQPASLTAALAAGASVLFVQPRAQRPTGRTITPGRAAALAHILTDADVLIVETDLAGAVATAPPTSFGTHLPAKTLRIQGYSTSLSPELRLAALGGPRETVEGLIERRHLGQGWSSRILQRLMLDLLTDGRAAKQVEKARREYLLRRTAMLDALRERGVEAEGQDGINVWVSVPSEVPALVALASQGIGAAPGGPHEVRSTSTSHILVTAGLLPLAHVDQVADVLAMSVQPRARAARAAQARGRR
jgi:DNA-binding transcriptional MocR family regulator